MSDTTEQECACCGFDTDCIDGLCQPCNDFNYKLEKLHKKVVVELQAKNKDLQRRLLSHISGESVKHTCQDCLRSFWNVDDEIIKCPFCDSEKMPFTQEPIQAENERLKEAIELLLCHVAGCWCKTYGMEKGKCSRCQAELALKGE